MLLAPQTKIDLLPFKYSCISCYPPCALTPTSPCKLLTSPWTCRLVEVEVVAGLLPALKRSSQLCCLRLPLSEGHIMALRRPGFLHNNCFLCSCPVLAGWVGVWVVGWPPDRLTTAYLTSVLLLKTTLLSPRSYPLYIKVCQSHCRVISCRLYILVVIIAMKIRWKVSNLSPCLLADDVTSCSCKWLLACRLFKS